MSKQKLTIHPLDLGTLLDFDMSMFTLRHNQGVKLYAPCLAYVILGGEKTILVDTGPCNPEWAAKYHRPLGKKPAQEMPNALGALGLKPDDIDLVIITHLHWDHSSNLEHFPNTQFVVQKKELEYAVAPLPVDCHPYEAFLPGIRPPWTDVYGRMTPLSGDQGIIEGVRVIFTPGHTPGFQSVVVETEDGPWVIAGDMVPLYANWENGLPSGIYQDLYDSYASMEKFRKFGNKVLPGHDIKVLEHPSYPVGTGQAGRT